MNPLPERLPEEVVEALSSGREDLVPQEILAALPEREEWRTQVAEARALSIDLRLALRSAPPPELDLRGLVADAIAAQPAAPSRRSLTVSAVVGLIGTVVLTVFSLIGFRIPSLGDVFDLGRWAVKVAGAVDRLVTLVPGGWTTLAAALAFGLMLLALPVRVLARGSLRRGAALALLGAIAALSSPLQAQTFAGTWPDGERGITLSVDDEPAVEVLRQAAEAVGLGLVMHGDVDQDVSVHVRDAGLRDVISAVLPDARYEVRRTPTMIIVRERSTAPAPVAPAAPTAPSTPAAPTPPPSSEVLPERTTFGSDVVVR
ncbi:MAG: hypothetical protein AAGE52_42905, partial [Myxococcota bacterium]